MDLPFGNVDKIQTVILVVADSLRVDTANEWMPYLQELGERNTTFSSCYSVGPHTPSSMSGVVQSRLPIDGGYGSILPESPPTIAEVVASEGVACAGWHCNPHTTAERGFHRGFEVYSDLLTQPPLHDPREEEDGSESKVRSREWRYVVRDVADRLGIRTVVDELGEQLKQRGLLSVDPRIPAERKVDAFENWLSTSHHETRFAQLHLMDTHMPYDPPDSHWNRSQTDEVSSRRAQALYRKMRDEDHELSDDELADLRRLYEVEAEYVDNELKRLVSILKSENCWDSSLLLFTSDHGELFGEQTSPGGSYTGHPSYLCEELTHVPLLLAGGPVSSNCHTSLVSGLDLAPTISVTFGATPPDEWEGDPLGTESHDQVVSTVSGHPAESSDEIDPEWLHVSVRTEDRTVLWWRNETSTEFYLRKDGTEAQDREPDHVEYESELDIARSFRDTSVTTTEVAEQPVDERRLRELGYL